MRWMRKCLTRSYGNVFNGNPMWNAIPTSGGELYNWSDRSTYIANPPFFENLSMSLTPLQEIHDARVLGFFGDSITTDHISPAGSIAKGSPAAKWLEDHDVAPFDFNQYGTRRGNRPGDDARHLCQHAHQESSARHQRRSAHAASARRVQSIRSLTRRCVTKQKAFRSSFSRAKNTAPVRRAIGQPKARCCSASKRSLPNRSSAFTAPTSSAWAFCRCVFIPGENAESLGLTGRETYDILGINDDIKPRQMLKVIATDDEGRKTEFEVIARLDTPIDVDYYKNGGILQTVLRNLAKG